MRINTDSYQFTLSFPPSVNHYWKHGKTSLSQKGKNYKHTVNNELLAQTNKMKESVQYPLFKRPVSVRIDVFFPDRKKRDLDNLLKAPLDAMQQTVYQNDSQIKQITIREAGFCEHGRLEVKIDPFIET